jgi:peptide/nickel transport system permease protein
MGRYLVRQATQAVLTLLLVSVMVFAAGRVIGDPLDLYLPPNASPEQEAAIRSNLGLDRPLVVQYGSFVSNAAVGDLGRSITSGIPVIDLVRQSLPASLRLAVVSMATALLIGMPLGVLAAVRRGRFWDYFARLVSVIGQSVPSFVIGLLLMLWLAVKVGWLPTSGTGSWKHYVLPAVSMGVIVAANVTRLMRTSMLEVLSSDYIRMHRIKGLSERQVIWKHAVRNAIGTIIGFSAVYIVILVTNAVVIETVFTWPGFGRLAYQAVRNRDYPLIQGVVMVGALLYVVSSFIADALAVVANPRLRAARTAP